MSRVNRKKVRNFYSKLLKYSFPKGAVELGVNSNVVRKTLETSLKVMRDKGWNINLNMRDKRKTYSPICYIECGIDYRPRGGVSLVVNIIDINNNLDVYVQSISELLGKFQAEAFDVPEKGEDIEYLHEEDELPSEERKPFRRRKEW